MSHTIMKRMGFITAEMEDVISMVETAANELPQSDAVNDYGLEYRGDDYSLETGAQLDSLIEMLCEKLSSFIIITDDCDYEYVDGKLFAVEYNTVFDDELQILNWNLSEPPLLDARNYMSGNLEPCALVLYRGQKYITSADPSQIIKERCIDGIPFLRDASVCQILADMWLEEVGKGKGYVGTSVSHRYAERNDGVYVHFEYKTGASVYAEYGTIAHPSTWYRVLVEG